MPSRAASTAILLVRRFVVPRFLPPVYGKPLGLGTAIYSVSENRNACPYIVGAFLAQV